MPATEACLADLVAEIDVMLDTDMTYDHVLKALCDSHGGRQRYANGTYELRLAGVPATCTAGGYNLLRAWQRRARTRVEAMQNA